MDDLISRAKAINAADIADYTGLAVEDVKKVTDEVIKEIKKIPSEQPELTLESAVDYLHSIGWMQEHDRIMSASAQPEREKGNWVYGEDEYGIDGYHCDKCGFFVPWEYAHNFINYIEDYNFCPSCGADMRGEEDDT